MHLLKDLMESNSKSDELFQAMKEMRADIIDAFKNENYVFILKIRYNELAAKLNKEKATFDNLLQQLEHNFMNNINPIDTNCADCNSDTNDNSDITSCIYSPLSPPVRQSFNYSNDRDLHLENKEEIKKQFTDITILSNSTSEKVNLPYTKSVESFFKISKSNKYSNKGFKVFTNCRNNCKPIYGSTTLYCKETCENNKTELRKYLIEFGKFNNEMIENITFKQRGFYERYSLINVKCDLKYIKKRIKKLNKLKGNIDNNYNIIQIYKKTKLKTPSMFEMSCNMLYINNFDILGMNSHKRFTKLFLEYGELNKYIKMGIDRDKNPYAIVHFKYVNDAKRCIDSELIFDGKILNIKCIQILRK